MTRIYTDKAKIKNPCTSMQMVVRYRLPKEERKKWANRTIEIVNHPYPADGYNNAMRCLSLLPHAQAVLEEATEYEIVQQATAILLEKTGLYLYRRGVCIEALQLLVRAQKSYTKVGVAPSEFIRNLNNLACVLGALGQYSDADQFLRRALEIYENQLGFEHPDSVSNLINLALLLHVQDKDSEAEAFYRRALEISEKIFGSNHPNVAKRLINLAFLLYVQGKYGKAEPFLRHALEIYEKTLKSGRLNVMRSSILLFFVLLDQGKHVEALQLLRGPLEIHAEHPESDHPNGTPSLDNLATLAQIQGNWGKINRKEYNYRDSESAKFIVNIYFALLDSDYPFTKEVSKNFVIIDPPTQ